MSTDHQEPVDLLEELSKGEDEFDVDLMACGCRLAAVTRFDLSIYDLVRLYNLEIDELVALVGALIDETEVPHDRLHELAEAASKGELREEDPRGGKAKRVKGAD